jgi:hypothetical protein
MSFKFTVDTQGSSSDNSFDQEVIPVKKKVFIPTEEQELAKDMAMKESILKIQAVSGSGKTSELVYISTFLPERSLYMTFNVTMAREADGKFGDHVECMTTHSLAYRKIGKGYQHKLSRPQGRYVNVALTGSEVARFFRLPDFEINKNEDISKNFLGLIIKETVERFEMSDQKELGMNNIPSNHIKSFEKKYGSDFQKKKFKAFILRQAVRLWEERIDKYSEVCCKHNTYLKLYQLSEPDLSKDYDIIYTDEAQDLNPVTRSIIMMQQNRCKLLIVGDKFQQIYSWNGSINALQSIPAPEANLSKSFRFGEEVAELASMILGDSADVKGNEKIKTVVGVDVVDYTKPHTFLFRTNMELIFSAVSMIKKGINVCVNIDMKDFVAMLKSADALFKEGTKSVKHENIVPFATWQELVDESINDRELGRLVNIVDDGEAEKMINILHAHKNDTNALVTLTTAHKSKGLEYNQVCLASDFPSNYNRKGEYVGLSEEERNLLYVAATRCIERLNINPTCQEFYDINNKCVGETNNKQGASKSVKDTKSRLKVNISSIKLIDSIALNMQSVSKFYPVGKGEMAQEALNRACDEEALLQEYASGDMNLQDAYEHGIIDESGYCPYIEHAEDMGYLDLEDSSTTMGCNGWEDNYTDTWP